MKPILLIGQSGQVAQELQKTLPCLGEVVSVGRQELDLERSSAVQALIAEVQPRLIINAAAYTAVDKAESEEELANRINGDAPTAMAQAAAQLKAALIHISTDYVFDGSKNTPYLESDPTNPLSAYGRSKLLGEQGIVQTHEQTALRYAILRTAWVYGALGKNNFAKTMLRLGAERQELRVVADQVGTPTTAADIAKAITLLSRRFLDELEQPTDATSGIYHFTNSGVASWYDFAVAIFEEARLLGFPLKLEQVIPITTSEYPTPAKRPAYSVLAGQKLSSILQYIPAHWRQGLRQTLTELYLNTHESNYSLRR